MPELPDLSSHPSPVIRSLAPNVKNLYDIIEITMSAEQVEALRSLMRKAAIDVINNDDFGSFDTVIHAVSAAVHHSVNK